jgi:phosphate/sulfate permease
VIWNIYNQPKLTSLPSSVSAEYWILVLSAASLVIGLATYGKRVTRVIGKELAKVRRLRAYEALCLAAHPPPTRRPCVEH